MQLFLDNYIIGTPKVICEEDTVSLDIITTLPFNGHIFVKGRAKDSSCKQSYAHTGKNQTNAYSLPLGKCGMQRLRSANPRGINFGITVVVSFHPDGFITKNDRAFHVRCFYMEPDEVVTSSLEVSQLPTLQVSDSMAMPTCEYSVHSGSVDGPSLTYANVGETVYHVWKCSSPAPLNMGMLVKKCFVTDGDGEDHPVVDYDGCSLDLSLLSQISYEPKEMKAFATSLAFKYADSNQLFFTCQIRMCQRAMEMCLGVTPPKCPASKETSKAESILPPSPENQIDEPSAEFTQDAPIQPSSNKFSSRSKRKIEPQKWIHRRSGMQKFIQMDSPIEMEMDVASPELLVLDGEERRQISQSPRQLMSVLLENDERVDEVCLPKKALSVLSLAMMTMLAVTVWLTMACYKVIGMRDDHRFGYINHEFSAEENKRMELMGGAKVVSPYVP